MRSILVASIAVAMVSAADGSTLAHGQPLKAGHHKTIKAIGQGDVYVFKAAVARVRVGTKVTWVNPSDTGHNVTATSTNWKIAKDLEVGATVKYTFKKKGTFLYQCTLHADMTGKIVVTK